MRCVDCRWFHKGNEICLKTGNAVFGIYVDFDCEHANNMTVFEKITESLEVLAAEFVEPYTTWDSDGRLDKMWRTSFRDLSGRLFDTREEAIAATVAKLKEVCNG